MFHRCASMAIDYGLYIATIDYGPSTMDYGLYIVPYPKNFDAWKYCWSAMVKWARPSSV